ncbi:hypothetical protein AAES_39064 [Amazona aestiva]|uniref:Uncharacterized protein n=1 Tax=Amazona aestiva TaxID=12930 RepID=A0A0Q3MT53_AMAAE|nr:hypothetical protein AAES_39064 [Amazona aestiva]
MIGLELKLKREGKQKEQRRSAMEMEPSVALRAVRYCVASLIEDTWTDHLKPVGGDVLIALDNAETPEHINEEAVHIHQTAAAAPPAILTPDNSDADLDNPFDPVPVDLERSLIYIPQILTINRHL